MFGQTSYRGGLTVDVVVFAELPIRSGVGGLEKFYRSRYIDVVVHLHHMRGHATRDKWKFTIRNNGLFLAGIEQEPLV